MPSSLRKLQVDISFHIKPVTPKLSQKRWYWCLHYLPQLLREACALREDFRCQARGGSSLLNYLVFKYKQIIPDFSAFHLWGGRQNAFFLKLQIYLGAGSSGLFFFPELTKQSMEKTMLSTYSPLSVHTSSLQAVCGLQKT